MFLDMIGNFESRKIDRYQSKDLIVSTVIVTDCDYIYETAISHKKYNNGKWIIVAGTSSSEEAKENHSLWVKKMTSTELPKEIKDVGGCFFSILLETINPDSKIHKKEEKKI